MADLRAGEPDDDLDDIREDAAAANAFEREYEEDHSWELLREDEHGNLIPLEEAEEQARARRRRALLAAYSARIRRGMIRFLEVILDLSRAASAADMRPLRAAAMSRALQRFVRAFFDENPLSQLGVVVLRDGVAHRLSEMSSSPEAHIAKLRGELDCSGDASFQNGLDLAVSSLRSAPPYGHREALLLLASLATCDPGDIWQSLRAAAAAQVHVSVVGLAAEVNICREMAKATGGSYGVALGEAHMEQLLLGHARPPPAPPGGAGASLVLMGFPRRATEAPVSASFVGAECALRPGGYVCPRCHAREAALPSECHVCGLTLVASPHLARSYHHLFPLRPFPEVPREELCSPQTAESPPPEAPACFGCFSDLAAGAQGGQGGAGASLAAVRCPECRRLFCLDCDAFIHDQLHNCPGCECRPSGSVSTGA